MRALTERYPRLERRSFIILTLVILVFYVSKYSTAEFGVIPRGVTSEESVALFDFVRTETEEDAVILFRKPRALALFTGRSASYKRAGRSHKMLEYLEKIGAGYVIVSPKEQDRRYLRKFMERNRSNFELVYASENYSVHRVLSYEQERRKGS